MTQKTKLAGLPGVALVQIAPSQSMESSDALAYLRTANTIHSRQGDLMTLIYLGGGLICLFVGGDALIRGAVALGRRLKLSSLTIGMIFVGFGTSVPELVVCLNATLRDIPGMAVGNVVGSNTTNILLILAAAALVRPIGKPARLLMPDGYALVGLSTVVILLGIQRPIPAWQGMAMISVLAGLILAEYLRAQRQEKVRQLLTPEVPLPAQVPDRPVVSSLLFFSGIAGVLYGADLFVEGATRTAQFFGVSDGLIGLTIVAIGTSLPELAGSIAASWHNHSDVSYGNIVGSNLFNLLGVLGASIAVGPISFPALMISVDGPVMIGATALMLYLLSTGEGLSRKEAAFMMTIYVAYVFIRFSVALDA